MLSLYLSLPISMSLYLCLSLSLSFSRKKKKTSLLAHVASRCVRPSSHTGQIASLCLILLGHLSLSKGCCLKWPAFLMGCRWEPPYQNCMSFQFGPLRTIYLWLATSCTPFRYGLQAGLHTGLLTGSDSSRPSFAHPVGIRRRLWASHFQRTYWGYCCGLRAHPWNRSDLPAPNAFSSPTKTTSCKMIIGLSRDASLYP